MADKPIIFSAPMVRALLDGRKTQTRRVIKIGGRPPEFCGPRGCSDDPTCCGGEDANHGDCITLEKERGQRLGWRDLRASYAVGDRLWVRENFCVCNECGYYDPCADANSAGIGDRKCCRSCDSMLPKRMRPSIHMPRWASRLTLIVTDVRVQRLHDISEADAAAEGAFLGSCPCCPVKQGSDALSRSFRQTWCHVHGEEFSHLWNSLHGPDAWSENPWAAAITFRTINANIDSLEATNG